MSGSVNTGEFVTHRVNEGMNDARGVQHSSRHNCWGFCPGPLHWDGSRADVSQERSSTKVIEDLWNHAQ